MGLSWTYSLQSERKAEYKVNECVKQQLPSMKVYVQVVIQIIEKDHKDYHKSINDFRFHMLK